MRRVAARKRQLAAALAASAGLGVGVAAQDDVQLAQLRGLSLEELSQTPITTVSRRSEPLAEAAGAVYLITPEDIRRSGATSLPEALRLAPNLQVAYDDAGAYSVTSRGFGSVETANKLLVMVDGRSVYAPLFGGVLWNEELVLLEDVERIEAVSGPGGALWGANAVNGVISVTTKSSADTQGPAARVDAGLLERYGSARYGGRLGEGASYRVFLSGFDRDDSFTAEGEDAGDGSDGLYGGFRSDFVRGGDAVAVHGQLFSVDTLGDATTEGGHALVRWRRDREDGGVIALRSYYDRSDIDSPAFDASTEQWELLFYQALAPIGRHEITWGAEARSISDSYALAGPFVLDPAAETTSLGNLFVQDAIGLGERFDLTLGLKLEHSSYSGTEYMPSLRLAWSPSDGLLLWSAVSRAVRTPTRLDRDLVAPGIFIGGPRYKSEELIAYEAGYRGRPTSNTSLSVSVFYNDYDNLRTTSLSPTGGFPAEFLNGFEGASYGAEAWGDLQALDWWRLSAGAAVLEKDFHLKAGATDIADPPSTGNDPDFQLMLRSRMDLGPRITFDAWARWVDDLPQPAIPAYGDLNARIGWRLTEEAELSLAAFNLLDESHPETSAEGPALEARRNLQLSLRWRF